VSDAATFEPAVAQERAGPRAGPAPRLVLFTRDDPTRSTGGVESFTQRLLAAFPGSEVVAYAGAAGRRLLLDEARDAFAARGQLARAVELLRPAAIVANGAAAWALRETESPVVAVFHGTYAGFGRAVASIAPRRGLLACTYGAFLERRAGRGRAAVVAVSRGVATQVRESYGVRAPIRVIENGASPERRPPPARSTARRVLALADDRRVLLFVGRAERTKGFGEVAALARARPEVTVLAAGVAPDHRLPPNLLAQGTVGAEAMAHLYAACDAVVLPSRYEGCSIALIDAVMADRPILSTATGCFDVAGETPFGIVLPRHSEKQLAPGFVAAADRLLAAPERFRPLASCRERFAFERFAREWRTLIDEVSSRGR
jgi:glycosyltransferase involved in cell wall biosynthesis